MPAPASTRAVSSANSRELWRPSWPMTTPRVRDVGHVRAGGTRASPAVTLRDEHAVHPLRAGAEDAAQAGGAELELSR